MKAEDIILIWENMKEGTNIGKFINQEEDENDPFVLTLVSGVGSDDND